jgi:hypothetical protein
LLSTSNVYISSSSPLLWRRRCLRPLLSNTLALLHYFVLGGPHFHHHRRQRPTLTASFFFLMIPPFRLPSPPTPLDKNSFLDPPAKSQNRFSTDRPFLDILPSRLLKEEGRKERKAGRKTFPWDDDEDRWGNGEVVSRPVVLYCFFLQPRFASPEGRLFPSSAASVSDWVLPTFCSLHMLHGGVLRFLRHSVADSISQLTEKRKEGRKDGRTGGRKEGTRRG